MTTAVKRISFFYVWVMIMALPLLSRAQQSDNGDGTYTNPVIWSDFPDNDVIRVGDTYYMVCTTMYFFPGVPILKSKDLVNWEYAANAIPEFKQHPAYDMQGGNRYGKGQWASSIKYHDGQFYILFLTLDEGGFLCTAKNAEGPWKLQKLPKAYYDAGLFFDDDGRNYVVHGFSKLSLTEVDKQLAPLTRDSVIFDKVLQKGLEGSHMYKINGYYYIYATYGGPDGFQACLRSKNIYGPYEEKIVLRDHMNQPDKGVHQGGLVQTQTGEWWSIIFQDRNGVGRVPTLQPVHWVDGWPIVGEDGRAVVTYKKPDVGKVWPVKVLPTSDEFNTGKLGMQWAWNHNPDTAAWSLLKRPGYLRLTAATNASDLIHARNTLTQRIFGPWSVATTAIEISHMKDGDVTGLGVLQMPYAFIGIKAQGNRHTILMVNNGHTVDSVAAGQTEKIYLRAHVNTIGDEAVFFYSFDNKNFRHLGDTLHLKFDLKMFTGNRFAIFNYSAIQPGGYVDVDWFRMDTRQGPPNLYAAATMIEAEQFDKIVDAKVVFAKGEARHGGSDVLFNDQAMLRFNRINFKPGDKVFKMRALPPPGGGTVEIYIDGELNKPYASLNIPKTAAQTTYQVYTTAFRPLTGIHRVTLKFTNGAGGKLQLDWFSFTQ